MPGARILVYDASLTEIGDGSGATVGLTRPIALGDLLTVVQRLDQCVSSSAYQTGAWSAPLRRPAADAAPGARPSDPQGSACRESSRRPMPDDLSRHPSTGHRSSPNTTSRSPASVPTANDFSAEPIRQGGRGESRPRPKALAAWLEAT